MGYTHGVAAARPAQSEEEEDSEESEDGASFVEGEAKSNSEYIASNGSP